MTAGDEPGRDIRLGTPARVFRRQALEQGAKRTPLVTDKHPTDRTAEDASTARPRSASRRVRGWPPLHPRCRPRDNPRGRACRSPNPPASTSRLKPLPEASVGDRVLTEGDVSSAVTRPGALDVHMT